MLEIGKYNTLTILRDTKVGLYLGNTHTDPTGKEDVLLPNKYVPDNFEIGDELVVFVYLDHKNRPVATTLVPHILRNEFALLRVNHTNEFGAFLDWGMEKDIFVPFAEQARPMQTGKHYLVYLYWDYVSGRLMASSKINQFLSNRDLTVTEGEVVDLIVSHTSDLGLNVIINEKHKGLLYQNQIFDSNIGIGNRLKGYIKKIKKDNKIDVSLQPQGYQHVEQGADKILEQLRLNKGYLALTDSTNPETIKTILQMSKKNFKKAVGALYKQQLIDIKPDGIYLMP